MAQDSSSQRSILWLAARVAWLAALWVGVNLWFTTHFGRSLTEFGTINAVVAAFAAILALLPESQAQEVQEEQRNLLQRLVQRLLSPRILLLLMIVIVLAGSFVSSVHVERRGVEGARSLELRHDSDSDGTVRKTVLELDDDVARLATWTHYGGRELVLRVEGRADRPVALRPWRPTVVPLDQLDDPVGVLLRIAYQDVGIFTEGSLRLACAAAGEAPSADGAAGVESPGKRGLVRLGSAADPSPDEVEPWVRDLLEQIDAEGIELDDAAATELAEAARRVWTTAVPGPALPCLEEGATIRAVLCTPRGDPWSGAEFTVQTGKQQIELRPVGRRDEADPADQSLCETEGSSP